MHSFIWQRILYNCTRIYNHFYLSSLTPYWENTLLMLLASEIVVIRVKSQPTRCRIWLSSLLLLSFLLLRLLKETWLVGCRLFSVKPLWLLLISALCPSCLHTVLWLLSDFSRNWRETWWIYNSPTLLPASPFLKGRHYIWYFPFFHYLHDLSNITSTVTRGVQPLLLSVVASLLLRVNGAFKKMAPTNTERSTNTPVPGEHVVKLTAWQAIFWQF